MRQKSLLLQDPDLGRLFANLEILGIWNAAVSLVAPHPCGFRFMLRFASLSSQVLIWLLLLDSLVSDSQGSPEPCASFASPLWCYKLDDSEDSEVLCR